MSRWYGINIVQDEGNYTFVLELSASEHVVLKSGNQVLLELSLADVIKITNFDNDSTGSSALLCFLQENCNVQSDVYISLTDCEELSVALYNFRWRNIQNAKTVQTDADFQPDTDPDFTPDEDSQFFPDEFPSEEDFPGWKSDD